VGTENDKHDNHEIIKTENTQENTEKHQESRGNVIYFIEMDKLLFTFKGNQNLLKQWRVSSALPPSVLAV
jgi:hypothetical protein